jgi:hypothetical protein
MKDEGKRAMWIFCGVHFVIQGVWVFFVCILLFSWETNTRAAAATGNGKLEIWGFGLPEPAEGYRFVPCYLP